MSDNVLWEKSRLGSWLANMPTFLLLIVVAAGTGLRLGYSLIISDPMSGPDAFIFRDQADFIAANGFLGVEVPGIPYRPIGYPLLLSVLISLDVPYWERWVQVFQVVMLTVASLGIWRIACLWAGRAVGNASLIVAMFLPILTASAPLLMYEVLLGCFLALGVAGVAALITGAAKSVLVAGVLAVATGVSFGLSQIVQPKSIVVGLVAIGVLISAKRLKLSAVVGLANLVVVGLILIRNYLVHGWVGISYNLGGNMTLYSLPRDSACDGVGGSLGADRELVACSLLADVRSPGEAIRYYIDNGIYFAWPATGPKTIGSTWFHGFDVRRLLIGPLDSAPIRAFLDIYVNPLWVMITSILFVIGIIASRRLNRRITILLASPPLLFMTTAMLVYGEPRQRIAILLFAIPVTVLGFLALASFVGRKGGARKLTG